VGGGGGGEGSRDKAKKAKNFKNFKNFKIFIASIATGMVLTSISSGTIPATCFCFHFVNINNDLFSLKKTLKSHQYGYPMKGKNTLFIFLFSFFVSQLV
jgi:hypothetical protein